MLGWWTATVCTVVTSFNTYVFIFYIVTVLDKTFFSQNTTIINSHLQNIALKFKFKHCREFLPGTLAERRERTGDYTSNIFYVYFGLVSLRLFSFLKLNSQDVSKRAHHKRFFNGWLTILKIAPRLLYYNDILREGCVTCGTSKMADKLELAVCNDMPSEDAVLLVNKEQLSVIKRAKVS